MHFKRIISIFPAFFLFASVSLANADDVSDLKQEVQQLKQMLLDETAKRKALEAKVNGIDERDEQILKAKEEGTASRFDLRDDSNPFSISGGVTSALQGTSGNYNLTDGTNDRGAFTFSYDLSLNARLSEHQRFIVNLEGGQGDGVNGRTNGVGATSTPFYDPYNTTTALNGNTSSLVSISTFYYEGNYFDGNMVVTLGKIDHNGFYDENAFANDETAQFMGGMFVRNAGTIFNEMADYYTPGLAIQYAVNEYLDLSGVVASESVNDVFNNNKGVLQVNIKPKFCDNLAGNYRFYAIIDKRNNTKISNGAVAPTNTGFGVSIDQQLTETIGLFARGAWQDKNINANTVQATWSGGFNFAGALWGRDSDEIGIAYGSIDYNNRLTPNQKNQNNFEVYYNAEVLPQVHLSPDYQYIQQILGGTSGQYRNVSVYGVRGQFDF